MFIFTGRVKGLGTITIPSDNRPLRTLSRPAGAQSGLRTPLGFLASNTVFFRRVPFDYQIAGSLRSGYALDGRPCRV